MADLKEMLSHEHTQSAMWVVAFVGVCVLVGLGKLKPETIEMLLMGLASRVITGQQAKQTGDSNANGS